MPHLNEFQNAYGTVLATIALNGTYSSVVETRGMAVIGLYAAGAIGSNAGSVTFRASAHPTGTGFPVHTEAGALYRVNPFAVGTYYQVTGGSLVFAPYLIVQTQADGTPGHAAGGTIVLVGRP
jgi:hypothetical protein